MYYGINKNQIVLDNILNTSECNLSILSKG